MEFDDTNLVFDFEADLEDPGSDYVIVGASAPNAPDPKQNYIFRVVFYYFLS
jgi:hypothetical protein